MKVLWCGSTVVIDADDNDEHVLLLSLFRSGTLLVRSVFGVWHTPTTVMPMVRFCVYCCESVFYLTQQNCSDWRFIAFIFFKCVIDISVPVAFLSVWQKHSSCSLFDRLVCVQAFVSERLTTGWENEPASHTVGSGTSMSDSCVCLRVCVCTVCV